MAGAMGAAGLALAVVGGLRSGRVTRRRNAPARSGSAWALGATAPDVMGMVLRQGAWLVVAGMLGGWPAPNAATRVMARFLFFVSHTDPVTFTCVTLLLGATALAACYVPAREPCRRSFGGVEIPSKGPKQPLRPAV